MMSSHSSRGHYFAFPHVARGKSHLAIGLKKLVSTKFAKLVSSKRWITAAKIHQLAEGEVDHAKLRQLDHNDIVVPGADLGIAALSLKANPSSVSNSSSGPLVTLKASVLDKGSINDNSSQSKLVATDIAIANAPGTQTGNQKDNSGLTSTNVSVLNGPGSKTGDSGNGESLLGPTNVSVLNGPNASSGNSGSGGALTSPNVAILDAPGNTTGNDGSGDNGVSGNASVLNGPGTTTGSSGPSTNAVSASVAVLNPAGTSTGASGGGTSGGGSGGQSGGGSGSGSGSGNGSGGGSANDNNSGGNQNIESGGGGGVAIGGFSGYVQVSGADLGQLNTVCIDVLRRPYHYRTARWHRLSYLTLCRHVAKEWRKPRHYSLR